MSDIVFSKIGNGTCKPLNYDSLVFYWTEVKLGLLLECKHISLAFLNIKYFPLFWLMKATVEKQILIDTLYKLWFFKNNIKNAVSEESGHSFIIALGIAIIKWE